MDPNPTPTQIQSEPEIAHDFRPLVVVYSDGRIHRLLGTATVPPSSASDTAVHSKDVQIPTTGLSARLYLPNLKPQQTQKVKLPLLIYFHGGGFVIESSQSPTYHHYLNRVTAEVPAVVVSVDYRRAPEHPLPAAYDDSWAAVLWAASLSDPWLENHADPSRMFFAGDSAGANIAHHMAIRFGTSPNRPVGADLVGLVLVHPFFLGEDPIENGKPRNEQEWEYAQRFWRFVCPATSGCDDPWINPALDGKLAAMGTGRVVVFVAEEDTLRDRGVWYAEVLEKSEWKGTVELVEAKGEGHVFHLFNPANEKSVEMMKKLVDFINN